MVDVTLSKVPYKFNKTEMEYEEFIWILTDKFLVWDKKELQIEVEWVEKFSEEDEKKLLWSKWVQKLYSVL